MPTYSHRIDHIRTAVGVVANLVSLALFISPIETFRKVLKNKSVEEFHFYPYIATILNCMLWVFYGTPWIHPHSTLIITINGVGLALELIYTAIYFKYTDKKNRKMILWFLALEVFLVVGIALAAFLRFHSHTSRTNFVGGFCIFSAIIMYGSPLTVMWKVIKTKSVEFMPFYLSIVGFMNGVSWTAYALLEFDLYVLIGNGVGFLLCLLQLILYMAYKGPPPTPKKGDRVVADKGLVGTPLFNLA